MTNTQNTNTLILRATPNPFSCTQHHTQLYNGNDGFMYDETDIPWLISRFGEPRKRRTKYGTSLYFDNARDWRRKTV